MKIWYMHGEITCQMSHSANLSRDLKEIVNRIYVYFYDSKIVVIICKKYIDKTCTTTQLISHSLYISHTFEA